MTLSIANHFTVLLNRRTDTSFGSLTLYMSSSISSVTLGLQARSWKLLPPWSFMRLGLAPASSNITMVSKVPMKHATPKGVEPLNFMAALTSSRSPATLVRARRVTRLLTWIAGTIAFSRRPERLQLMSARPSLMRSPSTSSWSRAHMPMASCSVVRPLGHDISGTPLRISPLASAPCSTISLRTIAELPIIAAQPSGVNPLSFLPSSLRGPSKHSSRTNSSTCTASGGISSLVRPRIM
mmetsp:Transcript_43300/g.117283  ORF Transcript_43300/g.117283 Transcript_43300/m.117283 type:complete len:239 (-) Transcript_43300:1408-2124(-)